MTRPSLADITRRDALRVHLKGAGAPALMAEKNAASAADVPVLVAALRAVLDMHIPEKPRRDPDFHHTDRVCTECGDPFPCRTYTAITAHIDTPKEA